MKVIEATESFKVTEKRYFIANNKNLFLNFNPVYL